MNTFTAKPANMSAQSVTEATLNGPHGVGEAARTAIDSASDAARKATSAITDFGEEIYASGAKASANVTRQVGTYPLPSLLIAGSLGIIAGLLMRRR